MIVNKVEEIIKFLQQVTGIQENISNYFKINIKVFVDNEGRKGVVSRDLLEI